MTLRVRQYMFPLQARRSRLGLSGNAGGFHLPQRDRDGGEPIPPPRFEDVDARREGRHERRATARRRKAQVNAAAHALRVSRMKAARASH